MWSVGVLFKTLFMTSKRTICIICIVYFFLLVSSWDVFFLIIIKFFLLKGSPIKGLSAFVETVAVTYWWDYTAMWKGYAERILSPLAMAVVMPAVMFLTLWSSWKVVQPLPPPSLQFQLGFFSSLILWTLHSLGRAPIVFHSRFYFILGHHHIMESLSNWCTLLQIPFDHCS